MTKIVRNCLNICSNGGNKMKRLGQIAKTVLIILLVLTSITGCGNSNSEKIVIYTSEEDYRVEYMQKRLAEEFPDYNIQIEYMSTGDHAAKLQSEGTSTECDITYDLEYGYMEKLASIGEFEDLSEIEDFSKYLPDTIKSNYYVPEYRNGGSIIINMDVVNERNLDIPESYDDLLDSQYKGLISMPNPKSSGTGYMFLKNLVNAWGEDEAFEYFDKLTENILQYTSSGSGPVNALLQKEVAIGLGMTGQAVEKINNDGANFEIKYFAEGSPFSLYGNAIIAGKGERESVKKVFEFLCGTYGYENCQKFFPEPIYADKTFDVKNYPTNIKYSDMSNDTYAEKERLLSKWKY